ncbi:small ribosomal subunit protein mS26-like [Halictus rubicundus]|uniref:small ribosomal subunit protein mS26-like n=1 Tax=Halictus rubicundus TaxID=77578 RepID=UPI0040375D48
MIHLMSKATTMQCVRWKKKPIWLPTDKLKMFKVPSLRSKRRYTDEDFLVRYHLNKEWNEQVAAEREDRLMAASCRRTEEIMIYLEVKAQRNLKIQREIDVEIRKAMEEVPMFITPDNIGQAIAKALDNIVHYNAAIDLKGNYYVEHSEEIPVRKKKSKNTV